MPSSSSSSIYSYRPGGSLKFKGGESLPTKKKKKSNSKSKSSINKEIRSKEDLKSSSKGETEEKVQSIDDDEGVSEEQNKSEKNMTEAEKKFQEIKRKRMADRVTKEANLSHKDRVDQFNKSLAERTEHNDMLTVAGH